MSGKFINNTLHFVNGKQLTTIFFKPFTDGYTHSVFKRRDNQQNL